MLSTMLEHALQKAAQHDSGGKQRIYAVCVDKRGNILASAGNTYTKSHPAQAIYANRSGMSDKCFLHAELLCMLRVAKQKKKPYKLYVARAGRGSNKALCAAPCAVCRLMLETEFPDVIVEHT